MADITIDQISTQTFYQIPQIFLPSIEKEYGSDGRVKKKIKLTSPYARKLSNDAKLAYGTLYNRCLLSIRSYHQGVKDYVDENGSVFMVYTVEELMEVLDKGKMTVHKIKKELQETGLLREVSQGANRPNRLYLQNVNANLQEYEHYQANYLTSGRDKGKVTYIHVKTVNLNGEVLFELPKVPEDENGSPKSGRPTNPEKSMKNGSPENGRPKSIPQGVHIMDGSNTDNNNSGFLDNSSRRAGADTATQNKNKEKYVAPEYYSLLQVIADKYNDRYIYPHGYTLTHNQKMRIGQYLTEGFATSTEVLNMIDHIPHDCEKPLAYLLAMLENLKTERQAEVRRVAHLNAQRYYEGGQV
ncbi:replication initiator protein A [Streptococcus suis]|uniref:replication initiator protein A n=1 Tax=Streptococcus suis TaxID=1307 RepID=UPI0028C41A4C|nr:replication initiator protein A [Streptococcus suis]WNO83028.1 replication initiator protein A [Streptococcus suis]